MPSELRDAKHTLYVMERFGYRLQDLKNEHAELLGLLELERLGGD